MLSGSESQNVPLPANQREPVPEPQRLEEPPDPSEEQQRNLQNMFPCLFPASPHMRTESNRFETFDHRWPADRINASQRQIARAGFFFLGDRDRVKCWYCNGELQNWEPDDEPWTEHAKWFPTCEYLLQSKGPEFAQRIVAPFPNLRRSRLLGPFDIPPRGLEQHRRPSLSQLIIDPGEEMQRVQRAVDEAMSSEIVAAVWKMGFEERLIRKVIKRNLEQGKLKYNSLTELIDDLFDSENMSASDSVERMDVDIPEAYSPADDSNAPGLTRLMEERIRELQDERKCKICLDNIADVVFDPCGHLCCCTSCSSPLRNCPICRMKIDKSIKTYMA